MIKTITQTVGGCPTRWEGWLEDGTYFYVRFRWGYLRIGFGKTEAEGDENVTFGEQISDGLDGVISWDEVAPYFQIALEMYQENV